jgi:hypothetical protein
MSLKTTQVYIELVIIGLESFFGFVLLGIALMPDGGIIQITMVLPMLHPLLLGVSLALVVYVLGVIADRIADFFTRPIERYLRARNVINSASIQLIQYTENQTGYLFFTRHRTRLLRATAVNAWFIASVLAFIGIHASGAPALHYLPFSLGALLPAILYPYYYTY